MSGVLVGFVVFLVASAAIYLCVQCIGPAAGADSGHGHGHGHGHH